MPLQLTQYPSTGYYFNNANDCLNPSFETDLSHWGSNGFVSGSGGAATWGRNTNGNGMGDPAAYQMHITTQATNSDGAGFLYYSDPWAGGIWKYVSAYFKGSVFLDYTGYVFFYDAFGNSLGATQLSRAAVSANTWQRIEGVVQAPANSAFANIRFNITNSYAAPAGTDVFLDRVMIVRVPDNSVSTFTYFDGNSAATATSKYSWSGVTNSSRSLEYASPGQFPTLFPIQATDIYDINQQSRSIVHQLLSGNVGATLLSGGMRSGTLKLIFGDEKTAEGARYALQAATLWRFDDSDVPQEGMVFVVNGAVRKYQSLNRSLWRIDIPFNEVTP